MNELIPQKRLIKATYSASPFQVKRLGSFFIISELTTSDFRQAKTNSVLSGAKKERPKLNRLLSQIRDGDQLVIDKLSRLGRSHKHLIQIVSDLEDQGVTFCLSQGLD